MPQARYPCPSRDAAPAGTAAACAFTPCQGLALWCAIGAALGFAAWGEGRAPLPALVLPLLVSSAPSRAQAFCVAAGYAAALLRHAVAFIAAWFEHGWSVGMAGVGVYVLLTGAVWACGWTGSPRLRDRAAAISLAWWLALLASAAVPGHPLIAAGFALPGTGWLGVALAALSPAVALTLGAAAPPAMRRALLAVLVLTLVGAGLLLRAQPNLSRFGSIEAWSTTWGPLAGTDVALQRLQNMGSITSASPARVVVWPESILGRYEPALAPVLDIELLRPARAADRTLVIGMDLPMAGNRLRNTAVAFYPDGRRAVAIARQPAPLSLWKPWRRSDTFVADWRASNLLDLPDGERAAVIFCYEEYVPLLYLLNEAFDAPTLYLALANTWAASEPEAAAIQTWHSLGMARLFGRPYLKAENRPVP